MKVIVQLDEEEKIFDDVTKIDGILAFDMFANHMIIHQGKKKTKIYQYNMIGFEVKE